MNGIYSVVYNSKAVGEATVQQDGLYYVFHCRVNLPKKQLYRLQLCGSQITIDLGICVPVGEYFELNKRLPMKEVSEEPMLFQIVSGQEQDCFVPVAEDKPFARISQLHSAKFTVHNHTAGVIIEQCP